MSFTEALIFTDDKTKRKINQTVKRSYEKADEAGYVSGRRLQFWSSLCVIWITDFNELWWKERFWPGNKLLGLDPKIC